MALTVLRLSWFYFGDCVKIEKLSIHWTLKKSWAEVKREKQERRRERKKQREIFHIQPNENFEMPLPFKLSFRKKESLIKVQFQAYSIYLFLYYSSKWPWWWEVYWQDQTTVVVKLYRYLPFPYLQPYVVYTLNVWHALMVGWHSISQSGMLFGPSAGEQSSKTLVGLNTGVFFSSYCPQAPPTPFSRWTRIHEHIPLYKPQTKNKKKPVERWGKFCFPDNSLNYWLQKKPLPINYASVTK